LDGSYLLLWNGPGQWKEEISFPGYSETQVGSKGVLFIKRNADVIPFRIFQLHSALGYGSEGIVGSFFNQAPRAQETIKKVHERKIDGAKAECVEILTPEKYTREVCIDQTTGTLIREKQLFRDQQLTPIGSKVFPRSVALIEHGKSVAEARITEFKTSEQLPPSLFDPPSGVTSRAGCMNPTQGHVTFKVPPHYPEEDRYARRQGTVAVYTVIDKSGIPQGLRIVWSAGSSLDKASIDAVRQWRYEASICNGNPVDTETVIEVHYTLAN
jgi:TonB family protein